MNLLTIMTNCDPPTKVNLMIRNFDYLYKFKQ